MPEYENGKGSRPLPFPLRENEYSENTTNNIEPASVVNPSWFPNDNQDEQVDFVVRMSLSQFTAIASAIDIGRDIGYGEQSFDLWRTWCKALIGELIVACEDIADCIEENEATQLAIASAIGSNTTLQETIINQTGGLGDTNQIVGNRTKFSDRNPPDTLQADIKELENCDLDKLWGGIRYGLVERADDDVRTVLESLAAISSVPDRLIEFLELVPIVGDIAQATLDLATEAIPTLLTFFDSYSSLDHLDEYACGLFSIVCAECRYPTFEEVWNYNKSFGIEDMPELAAAVFQAVMDALVGSTETASQIAYFTLMNFRLATLLLQATFNGKSGTAAVIRDATLGEDFGNDNWLELCEACDDTYRIFTLDFSEGQHDSYKDGVTVTGAVYVPGEGWRAGVYGAGKRGDICIRHDPAWKIRGVGMQITGAAPAQRIFYRRPTWQSNTGIVSPSAGTTCGDYTGAWDGYAGVSGYNEILFFWTCAASEVSTLRKITIIYDNGFSPPTAIPTSDGTVC